MAGVVSLHGVDALIERLRERLFDLAGIHESLSDRHWLMRWRDGHRTHHLHIVVRDGAQWSDRFAFRDALQQVRA